MGADSEASFANTVCLPFLRKAQNADGGWGFHPGSQSQAEPTCWAVLALRNAVDDAGAETSESIARGMRFLRDAQLTDGSWPATPEEKTGCWVTSLVCWVLSGGQEWTKAIAAGLNWLCADWPRDSNLWHRFLARFSSERHIFPINNSYRGWGWTPRTSSWVEPTAFALLALQHAPHETLPPAARRRQQLAKALLYDRMCLGGGWNSGNARVYGVAGEPLVVPTVWTLLALRGNAQRAENSSSLAWLEGYIPNIRGAGSQALAHVCLKAYGRAWPSGAQKLSDFYQRNAFLESVQVAAWACLAFTEPRLWLAPSRAEAA
jgi:hypothetical protein